MKTLKIYFTALFLMTVVNLVNRKLVKRKNGTLDGYDRQEAFALDVFAGWNYRTFWKTYLTDGSENSYWCKEMGETISSCLGENILRKTHSKIGRKGKLGSWFHGQMLSKWLDVFFKETDHCINARKAFLTKQKKREL